MFEWNGRNRRKFSRVKYPCLVVFQDGKSENSDVILCHAEDISVGGVRLIIKEDIKKNDPVDLELDLLDMENHIKCSGTVVWNTRRKADAKHKPLYYEIGIEFDGLAMEEHLRLQKIVDRLKKNYRDPPLQYRA